MNGPTNPEADPLIGRILGHYRLVERIGAGGMGVVYRAQDLRLDRSVALKVLPHGSLADSEARKRFKKEALALSQLNHPNIATIHDFDTDDGIDFLVMEYIPGATLDELTRDGGLGEEEVRRLGGELAHGLVALHAHGMVHRDLKPGNLRLTPDGRLKILDFGLARLLQPRATELPATSTASTRLEGTLAYMAPEQVRGEDVDARADVYAAGAVLYELATGQRLFPRARDAELLGAILHTAPAPPRDVNRRLSESLERTITRALAKNKAERWPSAADLRGALDQSRGAQTVAVPREGLQRFRVTRPLIAAVLAAVATIAVIMFAIPRLRPGDPGQPKRISVAVLPFHSLAVAEPLRFLGVGIPDAIITRLAGVQQLALRPTSAILKYENQPVDAKDAARALASDYVLTGMLQQSGDRLRVSVQLVGAGDGAPVWGDHYDVDRADLLTLQDRIAQSVADALKVQMSARDRERLFRRYTENAAAYELYLEGRAQLPRYTPEALRAAIGAFEGALQLDQGYAPARSGLAMACALMRLRFASESEAPAWGERAEKEARAALVRDPQLAEAHEALAAVYRAVEFDWERTIEESRLALELKPGLDQPHFYRAAAFYHLGLFDLVEQEVRAGLEANPANRLDAPRIRGVTALFQGRYTEAFPPLEEVQRLSGGIGFNYLLAQAYYYTGDATRAEDLLRAARGTASGDRRAQALLASLLAARHADAEARALADVLATSGAMDHHIAYSLGATYAGLGDPTRAKQFLRDAARTGLPCYPWYARDPLLDPLRADPEFQRFVAELRENWRALAAKYGQQAS
ncbi:MAG: protein kinase [Acidobacteria bacterium]|nr:protein kinase [Acidobacteriota bacterium]MCA1651217.1 protein kinase [Acidobacteriota bacterium]